MLTRRFTDSGQSRKMYVINESGLYSLIFSSKLPKAREFKHWVTHEVLPSIRKNGGYINNQENLSNEELLAKAMIVANNVIEEKNKLIAQKEEQLKLQEPYVNVAKRMLKSDKNIPIGDIAKILWDDDTAQF